LYTRGGDKGETSLYGSGRVPKESARVEAYGTIDELNSCIGLAVSICDHEEISRPLKEIQSKLFTAGADLASYLEGGKTTVTRIVKEDTANLEEMIDSLRRELPELKSFILPGGSHLSSSLHLARSVCRRAERRTVALSRSEKINPELIPFLNRLSTYLFNLARYANRLEGQKDEAWKQA